MAHLVAPHTTQEHHDFGNARYVQEAPGSAKPLRIGMQMAHKPDPQSPSVFVAAFVYHDGTAQTFGSNGWRNFKSRDEFMAVYSGYEVSKCHYFDRTGKRVKDAKSTT